MKLKNILLFIGAVALSLVAAKYRFNDSAHSIGMIKAGGGKARHPAMLAAGYGRYTLIATAAVVPPWRGDARVVLEGLPQMDYTIYDGAPVIDLSPRRRPEFRDDTLYDLQPKDRIALWVVMRPKEGVGALASAPVSPPAKGTLDDCCAESPPSGRWPQPAASATGTAQLAFYDVYSGKRLLEVPIVFRGEGGDHERGH